MGNNLQYFHCDLDLKVRYNTKSKPVGPLSQGMLSLGGYFLNFPIDIFGDNRYDCYSIPAGPLSKDMLTSAGFSFFTPIGGGLA